MTVKPNTVRRADSSPERRLAAMGLRLVGAALLSAMLACVKLASEQGVKLPELMFWRQAFAVPVIALWVGLTDGLPTLKTRRIGLHLRRTLLGLSGMTCTFGSALLLPLAESTAIGFMVPIFATLLSILLLKETVGRHRWGAILAGFIGMLVLTQPGSGEIPLLGALVGLTAAFLVALTAIQIRELTRTEPAARVAFWFSLLSILPVLPFLQLFVTAHDDRVWMLLLGAGVLGGVGQICFTGSLRFAAVSTVITMDYSTLIWSLLLGWLIWDHAPPAATWVGAPIIAASGLYIAWREHRLAIIRATDPAL